jgi:ABC-type ATPase with predicted acetyltransferase domain
MIGSSVPEGSGASKLVQLISELGYNDYDRFELATVITPAPALVIRIDNMAVDLDASDVIIAQSLTDYTRKITIASASITNADMDVKGALIAGDRVIVASMNGGQSYVILDRAVIL